MDAVNTADLEAQIESLKDRLADAEKEIDDLQAENADLEKEIKDIEDFSDDEILSEFRDRHLLDPDDREYQLLAEYIAAGETDAALALLSDITEGGVSPGVVKMLVGARRAAA